MNVSNRERYAPGLVGTRVGVAEGDATVCEGFQPVIGERDVIDIARKIARRVLPAPDLLDVNRPTAGHFVTLASRSANANESG